MVVLQLLAARLANVRRVGFYAVDQSGLSDFRDGLEALERVSRGEARVRGVLKRLEARGEAWGQSDGN